MKGGYTKVPQEKGEEDVDVTDNVMTFKKTRTARFYWKLFYVWSLIVILVIITMGAVYLNHRESPNQVLKPLYDRKLYKALVLENGLSVLLIHDKDTMLSGAGLDVQVGSMSDLEAGPVYHGLAHYTEHAMYMGSKDFPRFNELANYLQVHGGNDNAFTTQTHTNYYFYVNSPSLEHGLKIFAACFKDPLFDAQVLEGEKQAIQNELEKDIPQTTWKKFSILKLMADPSHPFQRFNVGSKEIFDSADYIAKIRWFYDKYYSSNLMNLVLLSSLPLETQENLVRRYFTPLPNKGIPKPTYYQNPYTSESKTIGQYIIYENGASTQELEMVFPIAWSEEEIKIDHKMILSILGDESQGTITSHLRDIGYIIDLTVSTLTFEESFSCITIRMHLTSSGCCMVKEIVKTVFDYLKIMSKEIDEDVWKDDFNLRKIRFNYHDEADIKTLLKTIPGWMSRTEPKYFISSDLLYSKFNKADTDLIMSRLVPGNLNIVQGGSGFDVMDCKFPQLNQYDDKFKSKYAAQHIPGLWLDYWTSDKYKTPNLKMPPKNEFIPKDFGILPMSKLPQPIVTVDEDGFKAYWKQDSSLPKSYINCKFYIPSINKTPKDMSLMRLYLGLVSESLYTIAYPASVAGYSYDLVPEPEGFKMKVEGFSDKDKFLKILELVVGALKDTRPITDMRYKYQVQEMTYDALNKIFSDQPFRQGFYLSRLFFAEGIYSNKELARFITDTTQQEILDFGTVMMRKLAIKCFTYGNHNVKQSLSYVEYIHKQFISHILKSSYGYSGSVVAIPPGRWIWQLPVLNPTEPNSCIFVMNEITESTTSGPSLRKHILLSMLGTIMKDPAYATLRTEEHLGYTVFTGSLRMMDVDFFYILLQGSHYKPNVMMEKVVEFLNSYKKRLEVLVNNGTTEYPTGPSWFHAAKHEAINHILAQPESQIGLSDHFAGISQSPWPFFNRGEYIVTAARQLKETDLLDFYNSYIIGDARQLIIQLHGSEYDIETNTTVPHAGFVEDMTKFKGKLNSINLNFVW